MLEGLAAWVLNTYVGEYVEDLNTAQLSIALLQGEVELENLPLKKDALKSFDLPLEVKTGFIGKIKLQIPVSRLRSEPWVISIEKLYLVAGPIKHVQYDEEKEKQAEQKRKASMLEALENKWKILKQEKQEGYGSSWFSYGTSMAANILENLQLKINNVHIRYEDSELVPSCPFAFGITIKSLSAQSTDGSWTTTFVNRDGADMMHKLVDLQDFSVYLDTNATMLSGLSYTDLSDNLDREMYLCQATNLFKDHGYILAPISAQTKLKRNTSALPLRSPDLPRIQLEMNLEKMTVQLSEDQYRIIIQWLKELERFECRRKYKKWHPGCSIKESARKWWKFAINTNLHIVHEKHEKKTKEYLTKRVKDVILYHKIYTQYLMTTNIDSTMTSHKNRIEEEFAFEELKVIREIAYYKVKKEDKLAKTPSLERKPSPTEKPAEQKGLFQKWFPGWGGWYGSAPTEQEPDMTNNSTVPTSDTVQEVGEPPTKLAKTETIEQEIMDVIQDSSENTTFLKKDTVFAQLNFCLNSGSFQLCQETAEHTMKTMLELECSTVNMMFESRPRTSAMKFGINVAGLLLRDKMTENSTFPSLVYPQPRDRIFRSLSGSFSLSQSLGSRSSLKSMDSATTLNKEEKIFDLMYEKNPSSSKASYKLSIQTKPLDIVYNPTTFKRVKEFFSTRKKLQSKTSQLKLTAAARHQYNILKEQTKAELKHTLEEILQGEEGIGEKRWDVKLDISAPQILVPENFTDTASNMVVLDLGHLHLYNFKSNQRNRDDSEGQKDEDDDFITPLSTPPSEEEGEDNNKETAMKIDPPDLSTLSLSESQLYDRLYEKYILELSDLQVMVGKVRDNWKQVRGRGSTHLHVMDKLSINVQLERRLIYTSDSQWPRLTVSGTMPSLTIHLSENKMLAMQNCLSIITEPEASTSHLDLSSSSGAYLVSDSVSYSDYSKLEESDSMGSISSKTERKEDEMREVLEDSCLLMSQFSINTLSLEIQSRDRAVAELRVTKVKANMTKRPYDTAISLTVQSLLVVDALQTYGQDFELLVASHRHVMLDSRSGSIMSSDPASPTSPTSPTSPRSPAEPCNPSASSSSLHAVQEAISNAFQAFVKSGSKAFLPDYQSNTSFPRHSAASPTPDGDVLISLDFEIISENSPSNTTEEGPLRIANFQFNSLDIIANQETVVELIGFMNRIMPSRDISSKSTSSVNQSLLTTLPHSAAQSSSSTSSQKPGRLEITADFHRLNVLMMRLEEVKGQMQAFKVATATMSSAKVQATLAEDMSISGSLGGFHILDVTPEGTRHQQVFSVGCDDSISHTFNTSCLPPKDIMFKTAQESMLMDQDIDTDTKAFSFNLIKGMQRSGTVLDLSPRLDKSQIYNAEEKCVTVNLQIASMCYVHSPRFLHEMSQCMSEFKEYMESVALSIKEAASEVAMGMMTKKAEKTYGSNSSMDGNMAGRTMYETADSYYAENSIVLDQAETKNNNTKIIIDAELETPIIVIPRNPSSSDVLVAHLGQISVQNSKREQEDIDVDSNKIDTLFIEAKDMNLYSVNIDKHLSQVPNLSLDKSRLNTSIYNQTDFGVPIVYNTTVEITIDHFEMEKTIVNKNNTEQWYFGDDSHMVQVMEGQSIMDVKARIATPLKLELSKPVYEQILQTTDNLTYDENNYKTPGKSSASSTSARDGGNTGSSKDVDSSKGADTEKTIPTIKLPSSTKHQTSKPMKTKVRFEVPLFNVEMKGDFDDGEKGLVDLKLHDFLLDFEKSNPYTTNIQVQLKSLLMEDLLEDPTSEHRNLMVSREGEEEHGHGPKMFLSTSCPSSSIITPVPVMPSSLPSSFHQDMAQDILTPPIGISNPFQTSGKSFKSVKVLGIPQTQQKQVYPSTPPPSPRTPSKKLEQKSADDNLVHIGVTLIDKHSKEYVNKFNRTNRFIDVDFNCLDVNINLQTWVCLLDFLGMGAKIYDASMMENQSDKKTDQEIKQEEEQEYVNSEINLKMKSLTLIFNKPEYELAKANIAQWSSHVSLRDGTFGMSGQLGNISLTDQSPHGELYRERFQTVGNQALVFDFFKYGIPDPTLLREYDISLKLRMASVRYVHTNRFQSELVAFLQHFLQLQDLLGRIRAASAGKKVTEKASRGSRIKLDIEASSPIILIPHSSRTTDVLVVDLGNLTVKNCFKFDGKEGTLSAMQQSQNKEEEIQVTENSKVPPSPTSERGADNPVMSPSQDTHLMSQSMFDEFLPQASFDDPMTQSIYGSLDSDLRLDSRSSSSSKSPKPSMSNFSESLSAEGSSVDPVMLADAMLSGPESDSAFKESDLRLDYSIQNTFRDRQMSWTDASISQVDDVLESPRHICLLDILSIDMKDMDLYSAERVHKNTYTGSNLQHDLEFKSCVIQRQNGKLLKERCVLQLQVERNLEGDISHSVPDWRIKGALSSIHCSIDINQYKLIRGILEHNLGEKLEEFQRPLLSHLMSPKIQTVLSGNVWQGIAMEIGLNNVTVELLMVHEQGPDCPESSLARMDYNNSTLKFDSYSDQSKDVDLVSHEIVAYDTRYRDAPVNVRPNLFEKILQPGFSCSKSDKKALQMEIHYRSTRDSNQFSILLNNMKLMCIFDWLLSVQEFLMTKPDEPVDKGQVVEEAGPKKEAERKESSASTHRTSPFTVSGGIITKRVPVLDKTEVPFELKLNVSDTQFVVVEDSKSWDTNAVILKCTAALGFRPKALDHLLNCSLQSVEVFSCSLLAEEETALSIIDPLTICFDLNANPLPDPKPSPSAGFLETVEDRQLLLEISFNTMNIRVSYYDLKMFLAILNSLPKQALQAKHRVLQKSRKGGKEYPREKVKCLQDMGFDEEDCKKSLDINKGSLTESAMWLTKYGKPAPPPKPQDTSLNLTQLELKAVCVNLCLIDDCKDSDVPLAEVAFHGINVNQKLYPVQKGKATCKLSVDYYNRALSGWEPLLETWRCHAEWKEFDQHGKKKTAVQINAPEVMNINITSSFLEQYRNTKLNWTEDYYKYTSPANRSDDQNAALISSSQRRRSPFVPFTLRNKTGCTLWFITATSNPSRINRSVNSQQRMDSGYIQSSEWKKVAPGQDIPFTFHRQEKIRHKKTNELQINQLSVKVDGWHRLSPVSVDKVGVYFRHANPDTKAASGLAGLVFNSQHDPSKQHTARVVFDVRQEGSARKVITVRSALIFTNKLDSDVELKLTSGSGFEGLSKTLKISSSSSIPVPLPYVNWLFHIKPIDWPVRFCNEPIQWQHVGVSEVKEKIFKCDSYENMGVYRFCVSVERENYPEQTKTSIPRLPGHTITLLPPVIIHNLLPIDLQYYLKGTEISGTVKPSLKSSLHAADPQERMELGIHLENFQRCRELSIPPGSTYFRVKICLYDSKERLLELYVRMSSRKGGCVNLHISAPYWLVNKSGLPLVFRQDFCKSKAAGQFEEHELARCVSPLLFCYSEKESPNLCTMRIGKSVHGPGAKPMWCHRFSLESDVGTRLLHVVPQQNKPDWVYNIGIEAKQGTGRYKDSTIVTFAPRYELDNQSSHKLAIAQAYTLEKEALSSWDGHLTALPKCKLPFHWPRSDRDQLLCVRLIDKPNCYWSGKFRIDQVNSFHINMRDKDGTIHLLKVETILQGPTFFIVFADACEMPPPFRIDNMSEVPLFYNQDGIHEERFKTRINPRTSIDYAWDQPTYPPNINLSVQAGTSATYDMNKLEEGKQLLYQNFIFLAATAASARRGSSDYSQGLVLDCVHDNHIVFKKKETGKRSQLWRMTSQGMLEHEGSMPPRDPLKPYSKSHSSLVLDIADIAPQPGKFVPLTLRKPDERRKSTQKWEFINERLCCSNGVLCVQALGGSIQEGAIAVLGPGPAKAEHRVPTHMKISAERQRPGSGYLSVRVLMDGPIRVLQIADIQQRKLVQVPKTSSPSDLTDDWEVYEEKGKQKSLDKKDKEQVKNLELSLSLKGGIGISLVNKLPEELLYVSLTNITMDYVSTSDSTTIDINVANIQADNQLFGTRHPVIFHVIPSKKECPDNTPAIHIAAVKLPKTEWNADIFKHLVVSIRKFSLQIEERLLWKLLQFAGYGSSNYNDEKIDFSEYDTRKALAAATSIKSKRYYFGNLKIKTSQMSLSMFTATRLSPDLKSIKDTMSIPLIRFEEAKVDLEPFVRYHPFETSAFLTNEIKMHYTEVLKSQAAAMLGSVDFLGNPLGLFNDVTEGISGLIKDGNFGGLLKNVTHGVSNSAAKVTGSLSDGFGTFIDSKHNEKREQIRNVGQGGGAGKQIMAGVKGFGHGLFGGLTSLVTQPYEGMKEEGGIGFVTGIIKGAVGTVAKPVSGVLDLASGAANAVRDTSRSSSKSDPPVVRPPRCCHGPGGLLPTYLAKNAHAQKELYRLNRNKYDEFFISKEVLRSSDHFWVLISNKQVYFLSGYEPIQDNIILKVPHNELSNCNILCREGTYNIELVKKADYSLDDSSPATSLTRRPQVRCDKEDVAKRVAQKINYARNLYDEQIQTLTESRESEDLD